MLHKNQPDAVPDAPDAAFFTANEAFESHLFAIGFRPATKAGTTRTKAAYRHAKLGRYVFFGANGSIGLRHAYANQFIGAHLTRAALDFWLTTAMDSRHEVQFNRLNIIAQ